MEIYLLRHGKAEDAGPGMRDRDRHLTPEGVESLKEAIPGILLRIKKPDHILTSPFPRAEETARIAAAAYGIEKTVEEFDALAMPDAENTILERLLEFPRNSAVMIVGHSPLLDELAEFLTGSGDVSLKKGGMCKILFQEKPSRGNGKLEWVAKPKDLKAEP